MAKPFANSIRNSLPNILVIILMLWLVFLKYCLEFKLEKPICINCIISSWSSSKHQRHLHLQSPPFWWWQYKSWNQDSRASNKQLYIYKIYVYSPYVLEFMITWDHLISKFVKLFYTPFFSPFGNIKKPKFLGSKLEIIME